MECLQPTPVNPTCLTPGSVAPVCLQPVAIGAPEYVFYVDQVLTACGATVSKIALETVTFFEITIENTGPVPFEVPDVVISTPNWSLIEQVGSNLLQPGETTTFVVAFTDPFVADTYVLVLPILPNLSDDCQVTLEVTTNITLELFSYEGNFQWYGFSEYTASTSNCVPVRYLTKTLSGAGGIDWGNWFECVQPGNIIGGITQSLGGAVVVNPTNGVQSGELTNSNAYAGAVCAGSSYAYNTDGLVIVNRGTDSRTLGIAHNFLEISPTSIRYLPPYKSPCPGYEVSYCGAAVAVRLNSNGQETLSNPMTLAQAAANGGAVVVPGELRTSTLYDPLTGAQSGFATSVRLQSTTPSQRGGFLVEVTYERELTAGGPVTTERQYIYERVGIGNSLDVRFDLYMEDLYDYRVTNIDIKDVALFEDDFSNVSDDFYFPGTCKLWPFSPLWPSPAQNSATDDGFASEDFECLEDGPILSIVTGMGFGLGQSTTRDSEYAYDDFLLYDNGVPLALTKGVGWTAPGLRNYQDALIAFDDFTSYTNGALVELTFGNLAVTRWTAFGQGDIVDMPYAQDDFISYSNGAILALPGGSGWLDDGEANIFL